MGAVQQIEAFLKGEVATLPAPDEAAWYQTWHDQGLVGLPPVDCALRGGMLADRLPWVFIAGYQATIRHVFPGVPAQGWAAYAATEDKVDPESHPPTVLDDERRLHGCKSWVAQSRCVDHLVVTVADKCVLVSAAQPGVHLSHREAPGFLAAMSQGFARFDGVEVDRDYASNLVRQFGRGEPRFVLLAGTGYLLGQLAGRDAQLQDDLISLALGFAEICVSDDGAHKILAAFDRALQAAIERFAAVVDCNALPDWETDRRLLTMYSKRIQERAARA